MPHYVILNRHMGYLEWSGEAPTANEAFISYFFKNKKAIDPNGHGWIEMRQAFHILEVTAEQRAAVERWQKNGWRHYEFPLDL